MSRSSTSDAAYTKIQKNGLLQGLHQKVYENVYQNGPQTIAEVCVVLSEYDSRSISPRFAELRTRGVLVEVGTRKCSVTGMESIAWDVTDSLPTALPKKLPKDLLIKDAYTLLVKLSNHFEKSKEVAELLHYEINQMVEKMASEVK